jgi:hypothetical protein
MLRGSAASVLSARATPPVSGWETYGTPAGDKYCGVCAWSVPNANVATAKTIKRFNVPSGELPREII